jgi:hypothetical protein
MQSGLDEKLINQILEPNLRVIQTNENNIISNFLMQK